MEKRTIEQLKLTLSYGVNQLPSVDRAPVTGGSVSNNMKNLHRGVLGLHNKWKPHEIFLQYKDNVFHLQLLVEPPELLGVHDDGPAVLGHAVLRVHHPAHARVDVGRELPLRLGDPTPHRQDRQVVLAHHLRK